MIWLQFVLSPFRVIGQDLARLMSTSKKYQTARGASSFRAIFSKKIVELELLLSEVSLQQLACPALGSHCKLCHGVSAALSLPSPSGSFQKLFVLTWLTELETLNTRYVSIFAYNWQNLKAILNQCTDVSWNPTWYFSVQKVMNLVAGMCQRTKFNQSKWLARTQKQLICWCEQATLNNGPCCKTHMYWIIFTGCMSTGNASRAAQSAMCCNGVNSKPCLCLLPAFPLQKAISPSSSCIARWHVSAFSFTPNNFSKQWIVCQIMINWVYRYVCTYICMCMYVCMHVCMYVHLQ